MLIKTSESTVAVLVSVAYLEGYEETIEILRDPDLLKEIREAQAEIARGEVVSAEQVRAEFEGRRAQRRNET